MAKTNDPAGFSAQLATRERTSFLFYGMYLPNPDSVLKAIGKDISVYREVQTNPYVRGAVKNRRAGVLALKWSIDRGKSASRQAKSIESLFNDIDISSIISELLDATQYGYQPAEILWGKVGNFFLPGKIIGKPPEWFLFNAKNELRLKTIEDPIYGEALPENQFLLARQEATYLNPYGYADSSSCFWPRSFMNGDLTFWVRYLEKHGMPKIVGKHPRGTDDDEVAKQINKLDKLVQDGVCSIPDDSSVGLLEETQKGASSAAFRDLIAECKNEISVVQLGHEGGFQSTPGKLGGEDVATGVRQDIVDADKKIIEQVFNEQLIPWIWDMNYAGTGDRPVFSLYAEEDVDEPQAKVDETLTRCGVRFTPKHYVEKYGLTEDEFTVGPPPAAAGTPPVDPNAAPTGNFAEPGSGRDVARNASTDADPGKAQVDALALRATEAADFAEIWGPVETLIANAKSLEDLRDGVMALGSKIKVNKLGELMTQAIAASELSGRFEILNSCGKIK